MTFFCSGAHVYMVGMGSKWGSTLSRYACRLLLPSYSTSHTKQSSSQSLSSLATSSILSNSKSQSRPLWPSLFEQNSDKLSPIVARFSFQVHLVEYGLPQHSLARQLSRAKQAYSHPGPSRHVWIICITNHLKICMLKGLTVQC